MIIGFGSEETDTAKNIILECAIAGVAASKAKADVDAAMKKIHVRLFAEAEKYKKMAKEDAPDRYSYFWHYHNKINESRFIVTFSFVHINRRHALSKDGWAALITEWVLVVDGDSVKIFREA